MSVEERWRGRPRLALALKTLIVALPLAASVIVSLSAARHLPAPQGLFEVLLWWVALMVISVIVLVIGEAIARRFLPLVALLRLSLLFPGPAPSRIGVARAGTRSELRRLTALVEQDGLGTDLAVVARTLVVLVGALDVHDRSTRGHSERVRVYTDMLAEQLNLEEPDRDRLRWAALLHDLGKLRVPVGVLNKREPLSDADWELIHKHPEYGEKMLGPLREWLGDWALVVRHHHERWDGEGYPDQLAGEDIPLGARVVAVADSYDVMTSIRSYQQRPRSAGAAREELVACAGTQFDPNLIRRFLGLSTRRMWMLLGPLAWLAQLPVVGPAISQAAVVTSSQTAFVLGAASAARGGPRDFVDSARPRVVVTVPDGEDPPFASTPSTAPATTVPPSSVASGEQTTVATLTETSVDLDAPSVPIDPGITPPPTTAPPTTVLLPGRVTSTTAQTTTTTSPTTTSTSATTTTAAPTSTTTSIAEPAPAGTSLATRACRAGEPAAVTTVAPDPSAPPGQAPSPPQPSPDSATLPERGSAVIDVLANDSDPDGDLDATSVALESAPSRGTVVRLADGTLAYTPDEGETGGSDRFVYTVLDSTGQCGEAGVTITFG